MKRNQREVTLFLYKRGFVEFNTSEDGRVESPVHPAEYLPSSFTLQITQNDEHVCKTQGTKPASRREDSGQNRTFIVLHCFSWIETEQGQQGWNVANQRPLEALEVRLIRPHPAQWKIDVATRGGKGGAAMRSGFFGRVTWHV